VPEGTCAVWVHGVLNKGAVAVSIIIVNENENGQHWYFMRDNKN